MAYLNEYLYARCYMLYQLEGGGANACLMLLIGLLYTLPYTYARLMGPEATGIQGRRQPAAWCRRSLFWCYHDHLHFMFDEAVKKIKQMTTHVDQA